MRWIWFGAVVLCGCFFDPSEAEPSTSEETDDGGTESSGSTASGDATTTTTATSAMSSSATSSGPGSSTSDGTTGSGSSSETGIPDPPTSCLDRDRGWQITTVNLAGLAGETPRGLSLSPDGLQLYYAAGPEAATVPYVAERFDRSSEFLGGQPVAGWDPSGGPVSQPRFGADATQFVARVDLRIHVAKFQQGTWSPTVEVPLGLPDILSDPGLDADGATLTFIHRETLEGDPVWAPYIVTSENLDGSFDTPERIEIPSMTLDNAILCPFPTADASQLLFGGSFPETWDSGEQGDLDVFVADREGNGWGEARRLEALSHTDLQACPTSITADGCEVSLRYFAAPEDPPTFALARMDPR